MTVQLPDQHGSEQKYQISHWVEPIHIRGIGRELADLTEQIEDVGGRLLGVLSGQLEHLVRKLLSELQSGSCKIAVLGQSKSGKSTLINSLIGSSNILPVDSVPCTSAVTRVHMGRPGAPTNGFQAHFFAKEEWQNVLKSGGLKKSNQDNKSKIPMELFAKHSSVLSERVRFRLGAEYEMLLGKGHSFDQGNRAILEQYVAAGSGPHDVRPQGNTGKYSDITKYADVFLSRKPFAFPVTIVDTPGTDDPLLMRDEITRQNLLADIYILVLTAQTPLSDADLSLIRFLHGLRKERLVIFVNRIDELSFVSADAESIFHYVRHQIEHEFPGYNIPIILGSAHWSSMSLRSGDAIDYVSLNKSLLPYAKEMGVLPSDSEFALSPDIPTDKKFLAYVLEFASGMPRLSNVVSAQMLTSKHAANLIKVVRTLRTVVKGVISTAKKKTEAELHETQRATDEYTPETSMRLAQNVEETSQLLTQMKQSFVEKIDDIMSSAKVDLNERLEGFIEGQSYELRQVIRTTQHIDRWYVNVASLRNDIEVGCNKYFLLLKRGFDEQQFHTLSHLRQIFSETYGISKNEIHHDPVIMGTWEMPLDALSQVVAVDIKGAWWEFIKSDTATTDSKCDKLSKLIRKDFSPIIQELMNGAKNEIDHYIEALFEQLTGSATAALETKHFEEDRKLANSEIRLFSQSRLPSIDSIPTAKPNASAHELLAKCQEIEKRLLQLEEICLKPYKLTESVAP